MIQVAMDPASIVGDETEHGSFVNTDRSSIIGDESVPRPLGARLTAHLSQGTRLSARLL